MFHRDSLLYFEIEPNNNTNVSYTTSQSSGVTQVSYESDDVQNNTEAAIRISGELRNIVDDIHESINYLLLNVQDTDKLKKLADLIFDNNKIVEKSSWRLATHNTLSFSDKTVVKTYNVLKESSNDIDDAKYSKYTIILRSLSSEFKNYNKMSSEKMSNIMQDSNITLKKETILNIIDAHDKPSKSNIDDLLTFDDIFDLTNNNTDFSDLTDNNELISHLLRLCLFSDGKYHIIDNIFINPNDTSSTSDEPIQNNFELYYICNMCFSPSLGVIGTYYYNKYISNGNLHTLQSPESSSEKYYIKNILKDASFELVKIEKDDSIIPNGINGINDDRPETTTTIDNIMSRHKFKISDNQLERIVLPTGKIVRKLINPGKDGTDGAAKYNVDLTPNNITTQSQIEKFQIPSLAHNNTGKKSTDICWAPLNDQNKSLKLNVYTGKVSAGDETSRSDDTNSNIIVPELGEELITNKRFKNIIRKVSEHTSILPESTVDLKSNSFYAFTPYHLTHSYHPFYLSIDIDIFGYKSHHFVKYTNQVDLFDDNNIDHLSLQYNEYLDYTFGVQEGFLDADKIFDFDKDHEGRGKSPMTIFIKNPMTDFIYMEASLKHDPAMDPHIKPDSGQSNAFLNIGCRMLLTDIKIKNSWIPPQCKFTNLKNIKDAEHNTANKLPVQIGNDMKNFHPGVTVESHLEKEVWINNKGNYDNYRTYLKDIYDQDYISNNDVKPDTDNIDTWWLTQGIITITGKKIGYFATIHDYSRKVCIVANQMEGFDSDETNGANKCNKIGDSILRNAKDENDNILFNEFDILKNDHILSIGDDSINVPNNNKIYGINIDDNFASTLYYINGVTISNGESVLNKNCEIELISFVGLDGLEGNDTFLYDSTLSKYFDENVKSDIRQGVSHIKHQQVMSHCGSSDIPQYYKHTGLDMNIQALLMNLQNEVSNVKQWALTGMVYYTKKAPQWSNQCSCGLESNSDSGDELHYIRPWLIQKVIGNERYILVNKITSADLHGTYETDVKFSQMSNKQIKLGSPLFVNLKLILKKYNYKEFIKNCVFNIFNTHYNSSDSSQTEDRIVIRSLYPIYSRRHLYRFSDLYSNDGTKYLTHKYLQIANINGDVTKRLTVNPSSSWEMCLSASNSKGLNGDRSYYRDRTKRLQPRIWHLGRLPTGMAFKDRPRCFLGAGDKNDPPDSEKPIYKKSNVDSDKKDISDDENEDYGLITATQLPPTLRNTAFLRTPENGNLSTDVPIQCQLPNDFAKRSAREPYYPHMLRGVVGKKEEIIKDGNVVTNYPALELELNSDIIMEDGVSNNDLCLFNQTDARGLDPLCVPGSDEDKFGNESGACSDSKHGYYWGNTYRIDDDGPGPVYSTRHHENNDPDNGDGDIYRCSVLSESAGFNLPLISKLNDYLVAKGVTNGFWDDIFDENEKNTNYEFDTGIADTPYVPAGNNDYFTLNKVNDKSVLQGKGLNIFNPERGNVNNVSENYKYSDVLGLRTGYSLNRACDFKIIEYNNEINDGIYNQNVTNINFVSMEPVSQSFTNFPYFYPSGISL